MRILVLHSDVPPDAPPEDIDTLTSAEAVAQALISHGHDVSKAPFTTDTDRFRALLAREGADVVFNLVEGVDGLGRLAPIAPRMLEEAGAVFTASTTPPWRSPPTSRSPSASCAKPVSPPPTGTSRPTGPASANAPTSSNRRWRTPRSASTTAAS